jgi:hypothetical protein
MPLASCLPIQPSEFQDHGRLASEFTVVAGIIPVPKEGFAVWVAKLRSMLLQ